MNILVDINIIPPQIDKGIDRWYNILKSTINEHRLSFCNDTTHLTVTAEEQVHINKIRLSLNIEARNNMDMEWIVNSVNSFIESLNYDLKHKLVGAAEYFKHRYYNVELDFSEKVYAQVQYITKEDLECY
jgi:predicted TIM-barrel fold metal-dependent hydrolase